MINEQPITNNTINNTVNIDELNKQKMKLEVEISNLETKKINHLKELEKMKDNIPNNLKQIADILLNNSNELSIEQANQYLEEIEKLKQAEEEKINKIFEELKTLGISI